MEQKQFTLKTLKGLGLTLNKEKSQLQPQTEAIFVGFKVSIGAQGPWLQVTPEKLRKLRCYLNKALTQGTIKARILAKIAGQCVAILRAILPAKLLLHSMYRMLSKKNTWEDELLI